MCGSIKHQGLRFLLVMLGFLVDAPKDGEKARPYWVTYAPKDILGWRTEIVDGVRKLTQLRLMEQVVESDGKVWRKDCKTDQGA